MSPFQFDRIYPNRKTMEEKRNKDGVFIGRYVLIEYNDENSGEYTNNSGIDLTNYEKTYDSTIWQKIYDKEDNEEKYVQIASLDTPLPGIKTETVSPGTEPSVDIIYTTSPETYKFSLPTAWGFEVKEAETEYSDEVDENNKNLNIYYNKDAFDKVRFEKKSDNEDWKPYKYYIKPENSSDSNSDGPYEEYNGATYYLSLEKKDDDTTYYKKVFTPKNDNDNVKNKISLEAIDTNNDNSKDTKALSLILPGLGNAVADTYDLLYGKNRNSFIYSDIKQKDTMYEQDNNNNKPIYNKPLYNIDEKSVVGLMNKVYDIIGRMKIKDLPNELNDDTIEDSDLVNTLFKEGNEYYLVIKYLTTENGVEEQKYKKELFNEKSLYRLIAEMQHLVSGSYESIFDALDNELQISGDNNWIGIEKDNELSYKIKHAAFGDRIDSDYITKSIKIEDEKITITDYLLDEAGHVTTTGIPSTTYYMPAAYNNNTIPRTDDNEVNNAVIPIGSIWYDTSP